MVRVGQRRFESPMLYAVHVKQPHRSDGGRPSSGDGGLPSLYRGDRHEDGDVDLVGLGLDEGGYNMRSVPGTNFVLLLSYKIERPVVGGYETDTKRHQMRRPGVPSRLT